VHSHHVVHCSVKAVRENIVCLKVLFPRIFELLKEGECAGQQPYAAAAK
jgi:hypothetical protein